MYKPNKRYRKAVASGNAYRRMWHLVGHTDRLGRWTSGGYRNKWPDWEAFTGFVDFSADDPRSPEEDMLALVNKMTGEVHLYSASEHDMGVKRLYAKPRCISPTLDDLYDAALPDRATFETDMGSVRLANVCRYDLDEFTVDEASYPELYIDFFDDRSILPKDFPRDYMFTWRCDECGERSSGRSHISHSWVCEDCYHAGLCSSCGDYEGTDNLMDVTLEGCHQCLCDYCMQNMGIESMEECFDRYIEYERNGWLTEPLDKDPVWTDLYEAVHRVMQGKGYLGGNSWMVFDNPAELVDTAVKFYPGEVSHTDRVPWHDRKGYRLYVKRAS